MNDRKSLYLRWFILVLMWVFPLAALYLFYLNMETTLPANWAFSAGARDSTLDWVHQIAFSVIFILPTSILGGLILRRHPQHRIGWILLLAGLSVGVGEFVEEAVIYSVFTEPRSGIYVDVLLIIQNFIWVFNFTFLFWLISIFPGGDLPTGRWRLVSYIILYFTFATILGSTIESPLSSAFGLPNPLEIDFPGQATVYNLLFYSGVLGILAAAIGDLALSIHRYRQAMIDERQQYKWLVASVFFSALTLSLGLFLGLVLELTFGQLMTNYGLAFIPIGVGFAVLRYRLYDVDLIIRRTLIYAALTGVLALIYFGGVTLLGGLITANSGQESAVAIVISTLAIAALFNPLRKRVQDLIDRRFYRRKFDTERTLDAFSASLREQVEMEQLIRKLTDVVEQTLQPDELSIWLKPVQENRFENQESTFQERGSLE